MDKNKMKLGFRKSASRLTYFLVFSFMFVFTGQFNIVSGQAPAPLFEDPVYHAVRDPTVVYNYGTGEWWMFYTQGRPANPLYDLNTFWSWLWNCDIGIAKTAHGDVVVSGSNAYIFYFNTDDRDTNGRQSVAQVARLIFENQAISCNRNATFELKLGLLSLISQENSKFGYFVQWSSI